MVLEHPGDQRVSTEDALLSLPYFLLLILRLSFPAGCLVIKRGADRVESRADEVINRVHSQHDCYSQ